MFSNVLPENRAVYEIMSKDIVETEGPQMTSQHVAYALHARVARLHGRACTHRPISRPNTYCFSTVKMIRKRASMLRYTSCYELSGTLYAAKGGDVM
jgi:hypothetical protein